MQTSQKFVELALDILHLKSGSDSDGSAPPVRFQSATALRAWAARVLENYSQVSLTEPERNALTSRGFVPDSTASVHSAEDLTQEFFESALLNDGITRIDLFMSAPPNQYSVDIGYYLSKLRRLKYLNCAGHTHLDIKLPLLKLTNLEELQADHCYAMRGFFALAACKKLRNLYISATGVGSRDLALLLQHCPLEILDVRLCRNVGDSAFSSVGGNSSLCQLMVGQTQFSMVGIRHISRSSLCVLDLTPPTSVGSVEVLSYLARDPEALKSLGHLILPLRDRDDAEDPLSEELATLHKARPGLIVSFN